MALFAVNGTLMRGLALNKNLLKVHAKYVRDARTDPHYKMWSISDVHPGMYRVSEGGASIDVELWDVPEEGLVSVLLNEPAGLTIGKVHLDEGTAVLGVLAEPYLCEGMREITQYGGWRAYVASK